MNALGSLGSMPFMGSMMKQPTAYFNSVYNKVRHLLAGQGIEDVGNIDNKAMQISIDKLSDCIEKMASDPVLAPEAYPLVREWYRTVYLPSVLKLMNSGALAAMTDSERERALADAEGKLYAAVKGKSYEDAFFGHLFHCILK